MEWNYITFRSVTYAQRGKKVLERAGISCGMIRSPRWMAERGCGYALKVGPDQGPGAAAALTAEEVPWLHRYRWDGKGQAKLL